MSTKRTHKSAQQPKSEAQPSAELNDRIATLRAGTTFISNGEQDAKSAKHTTKIHEAKPLNSDTVAATEQANLSDQRTADEEEERELQRHEVTEKFEAFLQCATEEELLRMRSIFFNRIAEDENPKPTLASAIVRAMRGELIAAPAIEGFDGAAVIRRVGQLSKGRREILMACLDGLELESQPLSGRLELIRNKAYSASQQEQNVLVPKFVRLILSVIKDNEARLVFEGTTR